MDAVARGVTLAVTARLPELALQKRHTVAFAQATNGSWPADATTTGRAGGRLTVTFLSLLTLEVYYRHLPLYKKDNSGLLDLG